jgi:hypothetical protein
VVNDARLDRFEDSQGEMLAALHGLKSDVAAFRGELQEKVRALESQTGIHRVWFTGDGNGIKGTFTRLDRLEQTEVQKKWWIGAAVTAVLASIGQWIATAWSARP